MIRSGIFLAIATIGLAASAQTNSWVPKKMSLEDCIEIALQHNLDVHIQRYNPELNLYALNGVYGAYDPNLSLTISHQYSESSGGIDQQGRLFPATSQNIDTYSGALSGLLPWGTTYSIGPSLFDTYGSRGISLLPNTNDIANFQQQILFTNVFGTNFVPIATNFIPVFRNTLTNTGHFEQFSGSLGLASLRQPLLKNFWIDATRLAILLDKANLRISELDLRNVIMNTVTTVEKAYYDLIFDQENIKVQRKAVELAERQLMENRKRVEVGTMAPLDEKQAQSLAAQSRADLIAAYGTEETQQRVLRSLLSDNYSEWENVSIQPDQTLAATPQSFSLRQSWDIGLKQRPDILKEKQVLEQAGYQIRYSRNQLFPELDLFGSAGLQPSTTTINGFGNQVSDLKNPFYSVGGQLTFPLGNTSARNAYKSAKAKKAQTELTLKQIIQNALIAIENSIATVNTDFQAVGARREARIYAEAALDAEQKKLENGKSTSFVVLQLQRDLTTARSAEIRALADYNQALADAALQEGTTLERRHIKLEWK
jgi:outer membrane protein TolC